MIDLYYWTTPNGHKITIFLEESHLPYNLIPVNLGKGDQFKPDYLKISPNNKMPAIIDYQPGDGSEKLVVFESGAILLYLANKIKKYIPQDLHGRYEVMQWVFWQVGGLGPMAGQILHFTQSAPENIPYAIDRYVKETSRLYGVLDKHLENHEYIADEYSIADMACYPWIVPFEKQRQNMELYPNLKSWFATMSERPSVKRAYIIAKEVNPEVG